MSVWSVINATMHHVQTISNIGLFHLMSIPPTDEQPVTNPCKTSKPPGQQTIVVFDPWTIQYKNVLQSMYYSMNPPDK